MPHTGTCLRAPPPNDRAVDFAVHQRALAGGEDSLYELYDCERHVALLALHRLEPLEEIKKRFEAFDHGLHEGTVLWAMLIGVCAFAWLIVWRVARE